MTEERDVLIWNNREFNIVVIERQADGTVIVEIDDPRAGDQNGARLRLGTATTQ